VFSGGNIVIRSGYGVFRVGYRVFRGGYRVFTALPKSATCTLDICLFKSVSKRSCSFVKLAICCSTAVLDCYTVVRGGY